MGSLFIPPSFSPHPPPSWHNSRRHSVLEGQSEILLPCHCHWPTGVSGHPSTSRGTWTESAAPAWNSQKPKPERALVAWAANSATLCCQAAA